MTITKRSFTLSLLAALAASALSVPAHAGPRLDKVMASKTLRVGTPGDYQPFAIKRDAGYRGHDIDVIEAMAKVMGVQVQYVPTSWPTLMNDLQADKFDVAVGGITRNVARLRVADMLPGYAPFGKVALVRAADKDRYTSPQSLNQAGVRVIKNPGGTNEAYVLGHLQAAQVSTHEKNAEIPGLIAEGKGDVMITDTYEALDYAHADTRLHPAFITAPLTPLETKGFLLPADDADYARVLRFAWEQLDQRGALKSAAQTWLK